MTKSLGKIIRQARETRGWTQEQFAEKIGKVWMTIHRQENDKGYFGDETLRKACNLLGLDYRKMSALKYPVHAALFSEEKTPYDSQTEKVLDEAQARGYKAGGIPRILPNGIIQRLRGGGPYKAIGAVRKAYEQLKLSDPVIAWKFKICEEMDSEKCSKLSEEDYTTIDNLFDFLASKKESSSE